MQGWYKSYVSKLKREGRLVLARDGGVDVDATRQLVAATAAGTRQDAAARAAAWRAQQTGGFTAPVHAVNRAAHGGDGEGGGAAGDAVQLQPVTGAPDAGTVRLRRLREGIRREAGLIELGLMRGELIERDAVDNEWSRLGISVRAGLEALVERLAPVLAAAPDAAHVDALLGAEIRAERRRLTRALVAAGRAVAREAA
mgnify:CR=1 FL=1